MNDITLTGEVTELLQQLIRNRCVNDGTPTSGDESRNVATLSDYFDGSGIEFESFEKMPGRSSMIGRIEGRDANAPKMLWLGHTDVVPATESNWAHDPYGGELIDGNVWGRGAVDMLNLTSSMAVALKHLRTSGSRPDGDIIYVAVADEETGGEYGANFLVDEHPDVVKCDYVITESGGFQLPTANGPRIAVTVGEKGYITLQLRVHGIAGHSSMPFGADNALVTAAKIVDRLASRIDEPELHDVWRQFVHSMDFEPEYAAALLDPKRFDDAVLHLPHGLAPRAHACAHMTMVPTVVRGGLKNNVIPDSVDLSVNIRSLPGQSIAFVEHTITELLNDFADRVTLEFTDKTEATVSPTDTPLWDAMQRVTSTLVPNAQCVPVMTAGGTDAYFFRRMGVPTYGFGLFSPDVPIGQFFRMMHGDDERIDQQSLLLSTHMWMNLAGAL